MNHFWKKSPYFYIVQNYALGIQFCTWVYHPGNITEQHYKIAYSNSSSSKCISVIAYFKNLRVNYMAKEVSLSTFCTLSKFYQYRFIETILGNFSFPVFKVFLLFKNKWIRACELETKIYKFNSCIFDKISIDKHLSFEHKQITNFIWQSFRRMF